MRRGWVIALSVVAVLTVIGIGAGAYNAGVAAGLARDGATEVVRVGPRYGYGHGFGFFPLGLIVFPLVVLGTIALARAAFWRGPRGGYAQPGPWGPPPWTSEGAAKLEDRWREWHHRQHERAGEGAPTGTDAANT